MALKGKRVFFEIFCQRFFGQVLGIEGFSREMGGFILRRSAPPEIEVQRPETNGYAMMFISPAKPPERTTQDKDSDADAPNRKHSHYGNWHSIDFDHAEGL